MAEPAPVGAIAIGTAPESGAATMSAPPQQVIGYGAMPGGLRAPDAIVLPQGVFEMVTLDGFGERNGLLGANHTFTRTLGGLAAAYGVHELVTIALSLDGRYDRHTGPAPSPDVGYVGDPHVLIRIAKAFGTTHFGGQLGIWVPGKDAPSIAGSAISVDARVLATIPAGSGLLSFEAGFMFDNSAASVDHPENYSLQDRVSLGVSDFNSAFGGAHLVLPFGAAWVGAEGSIDAYLGDPPKDAMGMTLVGHATLDDGKLTARGGFSAGYHFNDQWSGLAFFEAAKAPHITPAQLAANSVPLVPYEPTVTFGIGLYAKFGGPKHVVLPPEHFCDTQSDEASISNCPGDPMIAKIIGTVLDDAGKPVVGAKVAIKLKNTQPSAATDASGSYGVEVPLGHVYHTHFHGDVTKLEETTAQIDVEVDGKKPATVTVAKLETGDNKVDPIKLEPLLPPGQLRGVVHSLGNARPVDKAVVTITPGDKKVETAADGTFTIDLAPGTYKIKVQAAGFAVQELDVTIDPNGVAIKNIDLHK